ncbi:hypothetical protein HHK36_001227 [Tetracentron sinense]|uniref:RING-type domain-containing protein n=1 Tax=Tetracentron sinense TaxID=13715 RepID=A0A835DRG1_TETSI|nr:hypothetical protein HHK36_001227 [Tetracentron sinense]
MSSTTSTGAGAGASGNAGYFHQNLSNLGLGYAIAIALAFLVLLSTILLATYVCFRASRNRSRRPVPNPNNSNPNGIILPRIIFVSEDDGGTDEENLVVGLDQMVINSYPKFPFCKSKDMGNGDSLCSICLCDYKDGEMLRMMPDCRHFFHLCCIDAWLRLSGSCPVCRNSPLPTPLSTPLSELVPLSQYPGNWRR